MALAPVKPLYSASATATNGSDTITVTGSVNCSYIASGAIVCLGTRQLVDAISGTAPDGSGNSTIKLRRPWDDPTTTGKILVFMSWEGLADAVNRLRGIIDASEASVQGAFSFMGNWSAVSGNFPDAPAEGLGSQVYRISVQGTIGGRIYRVGEVIYYDQYSLQWRSFVELATAFSTGLLAGADAAAWRTALELVKTISSTDATAGRMLQVGAGGLLANASPNISDANAITNTSFFSVGGTWTGSPIAGAAGGNQGYVQHQQWASSSYAVQHFQGISNSGITLERVKDNNVWGAWALKYNQKNILGTASQSAGVPTGAIIERGSNANGEYVRFADGTQVCTFHTVTGDLAINNALAGGFRSNALSWTFPAAFSQTTNLFCDCKPMNTSAFSGVAYGASTTASTYYLTAISSQASASRSLQLFAIGRWF